MVNTARGLAKSYGERLRGCNVRNMNPEKAEGLSPELHAALEPLLPGIESLSEQPIWYRVIAWEAREKLCRSRYASGFCGSQFAVKHLARGNIAHVEVGMNSKTLRSAETWTEIVRLFARLALGASFLSAVADRFGLWGPYGAKNVSWGNFAHFVEYTRAVTSLFPSSSAVSFAWAATVTETLFGILLIAGFKIRMASFLSGLLLLSFAIGMVTGLGIKTPFDYSVFSAAAAAFLLAFWEPDRFTLDNLLRRSRS